MMQPIKRILLLAAIPAAWSCDAVHDSSGALSEDLTQACAAGTELAVVGIGDDAIETCLPVSEVRIVACPSGAKLTGDAPPRATRQRCARDEHVRHGASRDWHPNGRERTHTEWWEGTKHGKFKLWYEDGQPRAEGFHFHGEPAGEWVYYARDGSVLQRRVFDTKPPADTWLTDAIAGRPPVKPE